MTRPKATLRARQQSVNAALATSPGAAHAPDRKLVGLSVRLPPELHEELRRVAFTERKSIHAILLEGLGLALQKYRG